MPTFTKRPTSDNTNSGNWPTPMYSKLNDQSDATGISNPTLNDYFYCNYAVTEAGAGAVVTSLIFSTRGKQNAGGDGSYKAAAVINSTQRIGTTRGPAASSYETSTEDWSAYVPNIGILQGSIFGGATNNYATVEPSFIDQWYDCTFIPEGGGFAFGLASVIPPLFGVGLTLATLKSAAFARALLRSKWRVRLNPGEHEIALREWRAARWPKHFFRPARGLYLPA